MLSLATLRNWASKAPKLPVVGKFDMPESIKQTDALVPVKDSTDLPKPTEELPEETTETPTIQEPDPVPRQSEGSSFVVPMPPSKPAPPPFPVQDIDDIKETQEGVVDAGRKRFTFYTYTPTRATEERKLFMGMEIFVPVQRNVYGDQKDYFNKWNGPFVDAFTVYDIANQQFVANTMWGLETIKAAYPKDTSDAAYAIDLWNHGNYFPSFCRFMADMVSYDRHQKDGYDPDTVQLDELEKIINRHIKVNEKVFEMVDSETLIQKYTDHESVSLVEEFDVGRYNLSDPPTGMGQSAEFGLTFPIYKPKALALDMTIKALETPSDGARVKYRAAEGLVPSFVLPIVGDLHDETHANVRTILGDDLIPMMNLWKPLSRCWKRNDENILDGYIVNKLEYNQSRIVARDYRKIKSPQIVQDKGVFYVKNTSLVEFADNTIFVDNEHKIRDNLELIGVGRVGTGEMKRHPVYNEVFDINESFEVSTTTDMTSYSDLDAKNVNATTNPVIAGVLNFAIVPLLFVLLPIIGAIGEKIIAKIGKVTAKAISKTVTGVRRAFVKFANYRFRIGKQATFAFKDLKDAYVLFKSLRKGNKMSPTEVYKYAFTKRLTENVRIPSWISKIKDSEIQEHALVTSILVQPGAFDGVVKTLDREIAGEGEVFANKLKGVWDQIGGGNNHTSGFIRYLDQTLTHVPAAETILTQNLRSIFRNQALEGAAAGLFIPENIAKGIAKNMEAFNFMATYNGISDIIGVVSSMDENSRFQYSSALAEQIVYHHDQLANATEDTQLNTPNAKLRLNYFEAERHSNGYTTEILRYPINGSYTTWERSMTSKTATWTNKHALTMSPLDWLIISNGPPNETVTERNTIRRLYWLDGYADFMPNAAEEGQIPNGFYTNTRLRINPNNTPMWGIDRSVQDGEAAMRSYIARRFVVEQSRIRTASDVVSDFQFDPIEFKMDVSVDIGLLKKDKWANAIIGVFSDIYNDDDEKHRNYIRSMNDKTTMKGRLNDLFEFDPSASLQTLFLKKNDVVYKVTNQTHPNNTDYVKLVVVSGSPLVTDKVDKELLPKPPTPVPETTPVEEEEEKPEPVVRSYNNVDAMRKRPRL